MEKKKRQERGSAKEWKTYSTKNQRFPEKWRIKKSDSLKSKGHQKHDEDTKVKEMTQVASKSKIERARHAEKYHSLTDVQCLK